MASSTRTIGCTVVLTAVTTIIVLGLIMAGCSQMQDNSPISISNHPGAALTIACSADGAVAYATDGRHIYRYASSGDNPPTWQCVFSQADRLALAAQYEPAEESPTTR